MTKHKNKVGHNNPVGFIVLGLIGLGLTITILLRGTDVALLNPKGPIAEAQLNLMIFSAALLLGVAVPTLILLYFFAWKYRESNEKAPYNPSVRHGKFFVFSMWAIPSVFILVLALGMLPATQKLEPSRSIVSDIKPLNIQVIAMRWKWIFIYPEQNIATVNFVQVPVGTPVQFELTADESPMSSFWIPHLGGQLYAMTGHVNRLNLMAEEPGDYPGRSAEITGAGFADMKFIARASSKADFEQWVRNIKLSSDTLDATEYKKLLSPSENNPATLYSKAEPDLFDNLLLKYNGSHKNGGHE